MPTAARILTINAGSSSLKAALFSDDTLLASTTVERVGEGGAGAAMDAVVAWVRAQPAPDAIVAIAHRVVHGGEFDAPRRITPDVLTRLRALADVDPDHGPRAVAIIDAVARAWPEVPQIACFDTAFHRTLPAVARRYPLPDRFDQAGVRRYGFHGLSCESILASLQAIDPPVAGSRLVVAHLGSGASLTAIRGGESVETTMGFSPAGGIMMSTRPGDLDPGVIVYALRKFGLTADDLNRLVNREAGLAGVSGGSADMRDLLARGAADSRAAAAVALFCYLAKKALGGLIAVLGGLDVLVFTGGIGEHSAPIRARIAGGLDDLGLTIDARANDADAPVISSASSRVAVRVMTSNENAMLARHARRVLGGGAAGR